MVFKKIKKMIQKMKRVVNLFRIILNELDQQVTTHENPGQIPTEKQLIDMM
jgi:hypothetical protein